MTLYENKLINVIITAAGNSSRIANNHNIPKQYIKINGKYILLYSIEKFFLNKNINRIYLCINTDHYIYYNDLINSINSDIKEKIIIIKGSLTRQQSVYNCLKIINNDKDNIPDLIFIHDAARPNFDANIIDDLLSNLENRDGVIPVVPIFDTVKRLSKNSSIFTENRDELFLSQTPQLFSFRKLFNAHQLAIKDHIYTDDAEICEHNNLIIYTIDGNIDNYKITTTDDIIKFESLINERFDMNSRVGLGFDVHKFTDGNNIKLCGIDIPFHKSLLGHSDADVALHALTDAIYGSIGDGDIGEHFPPSEKKWANSNSEIFLIHALDKLKSRKAFISNIDIVIICEEPYLSKYKPLMVNNLSKLVGIEDNKISVKATTTENLGFTGRKEGIAVQCIISINIPT
ncbi:MAG: 2-C-methyl-D-erythritol 2,4-cyclodiphosphate synthase [Rhodobiaceae bacterium]|nr:2-C-methyl-D-erythritol 2,4-cyclodiphosphate synthase [Rhodobiaceae bacterium]